MKFGNSRLEFDLKILFRNATTVPGAFLLQNGRKNVQVAHQIKQCDDRIICNEVWDQ